MNRDHPNNSLEESKSSGQSHVSRQDQLEVIFNSSIDVIFLLAVEPGEVYRFTSVNKAFLIATGLSLEQVEGKYVNDVIPEPARSFVMARYKQAILERNTVQWEETTVYPAGKKTGIVNVTPVFNDDNECHMLVGTVHDITERKKAEEEKEQIRYLLNERVKELTTLYSASQILHSETKSIGDVMQELLAILPGGWQYPEITEARIAFGEEHYKTPGFVPGFDKQAADFFITDGSKAIIEITYTEKKPVEVEGPFLAEERKLINMLAEMLNNYFARKGVTKQVVKEKELSESIINSLPGIFHLQEITGEFIRWNKQFETVTGYTAEEIRQLHPLDFFDENDKEALLKKSIDMYTNGTSDLEAMIVTKSGVKIPYYFTGQMVEYEGRPCIIGTGIDITERKKTSEQLMKEKELSESIINSLPGIFYLFDDTGKYLRWNKNHETVPGYTTEEMKEMHPLSFFDDEEKELIKERIGKAFTEGYSDAEANFMSKDGTKALYYFNGIAIEYEGKPCLLGVAFDITERKRVENELLESEVRFREVLENSISASYKRSLLTNTYDYLSPVFKKIVGYTQEEMNDLPIETVIGIMHPDDIEPVKEGLTKAITELSGFANSLEYRFKHKMNDEYRWLKDEFVVMQDAQGQPVSLIGSVSDITEQKKIEQDLRQAEIKFRTLVEKSQVGVYIVQKGKFVYVNPKFAEIFGYGAGELIGTDPVKKVISEEYQAIVRENVRARMEDDVETVHYEVTGMRKDGTQNRVEFYGSRTLYEGQPTIIGTMVDITKRKLAEEALQKSEANLHSIFDTTDTIYALLDTNFQVMSFNHRAFDFIKNEFNQELKLYANLISYFPEDRQANLYSNMKQVLAGESLNYESSYLQKDGSVTWYFVRMFPIMDSEEKIFGMMTAVSDITEKKLMEQKIVNQKVQEQKRITRVILNAQERERNKIGQELHDNVNQILAGSKMCLGLANPANDDLINRSISLIDDAVNEIRSITREHVTPQRKIDLKDIIQTLVDNLNKHSEIKTSFVYDTGSVVIKDDLKLNIYRIIQEAVNNILKYASAKNAVILVNTNEKDIHITIGDDGSGFDPLSTKPKGIGISNMMNRVESYNGEIQIESSPGNGCHIRVRIPS